MKFFLSLFFLSLLSLSIHGQTVDFYGKKVSTNVCNELGFKDNQEAKSCLDKICDAADLVNNYVLAPCSNVGTCLATVKDGVYYILYDNAFLNKVKTLGFTEKRISNNSGTDWASITIMAHELGHHALGHFNVLVNKPENYLRNELQADEFAGKTLYKLGATLKQAQLAFLNLSDVETLTHPKKTDRLKALANGYNKEKAKFGNSNNISADKIIGSWSNDQNVTMTFFENGNLKVFENATINDGIWSMNNDKLSIHPKGMGSQGFDLTVAELSDYTLTLKKGDNDNAVILKRVTVDAKTAMSNYLKTNLEKLIFIDKFNYNYRKIGGITDINIPVVNKSRYFVELIKVKIEYILASGAVYKTEYVDFENFKPYETKVLHAPDSDRGTSIRTSIFTVKSEAIEALLQN